MATAWTGACGRRVFGLGVVLLAVVGFATGDFLPGQPVPKALPERLFLACAANGFLLLSGVGLQRRRAAAPAAAALTAYYALVVVLLMNGRVVLAHPATYGAYSGAAEQLAIAAGALIIYAEHSRRDAMAVGRLVRTGQLAFGLCAVLFGGAHFAYMNLTTPLVPGWLPPNAAFWAVATGVFHIAGGLAILTGVQARLAAVLLTIMYAAFTPLVHLPLLAAKPADSFIWSENALNVALAGVAWVVADSFARAARALDPRVPPPAL